MFYNTGIATYVWVLSNKKSAERKGKVQLINGVNLCGKMRKSLGSKRNVMSKDDRAIITRSFGGFETVQGEVDNKSYASKIFDSHEFGYRRITVERPLRLSAQITDEAVAGLRYAPKPYNNVMRWIHEQIGSDCYTALASHEPMIREKIKKDFPELKEKHWFNAV